METKRAETILVVDDEEDILLLCRVNLEFEGYRVITASSGVEALTRAREARPDLVLLDVMMPRMNGRDLLRAMRADPAYAAVPVILMSAAPDALRSAANLGARASLRKPFTLDALLTVIARVLTAG